VANEPEQTQRNQGNIVRVIEVGVRLAIVVGLAVWCFEILRPFLSTIIWALIIAAALYPAYASLRRKLGMGPGATSLVFTAAVLVALMIPVIMLSGTLVESAREFAAELEDGTLQVPPPPEGVRSWPVLGGRIYDSWQLANENLEAALARFDDQLRTVGRWFISAAARAGLGILQFAVALVVAGIFLAYSESGGDFARNLGRRLAGPRGEGIADMASATVRSVAQGVLGVACIQAILAGVGFMLVDLPGAGLWTLIVLILATVQLPAGTDWTNRKNSLPTSAMRSRPGRTSEPAAHRAPCRYTNPHFSPVRSAIRAWLRYGSVNRDLGTITLCKQRRLARSGGPEVRPLHKRILTRQPA